AEEHRKAEEARLAEEQRKAEEERLAEEQRKAEEARLAEEQRKAEEARLAEEQRKAEEERLAEEQRKAEEERLAEEQRKAEEERLAEQQRQAGKTDIAVLAPVERPELSNDELAKNKVELRRALSELPSMSIQFQTSSNVLTDESRDILQQIGDQLLKFPGVQVSIEGHTDWNGPKELNLTLSLSRATAVRDFLVEQGVSVFDLRARGFGEEVPIADNTSTQGRAANRRIEFNF
ncbi:MAG: OmpA family protein, partial [Granulosicoccus sp.]|nr:OmpA family protein [Granulosicoccus sp.]